MDEPAAPFYYGESLAGGTLLSDMQNRYSTLFLRRQFAVTNVAALSSLFLSVACDDGFVAWVNGTIVASNAAPAGAILFNSLASINVAGPVTAVPYALPDSKQYLVAGTNVLAVQVFNVNLGSSDIVFDAELTATLRETIPPAIVSVLPVPGNVTSLTQITVTFSGSRQRRGRERLNAQQFRRGGDDRVGRGLYFYLSAAGLWHGAGVLEHAERHPRQKHSSESV